MKNYLLNHQLNWAYLDTLPHIQALKTCPQDPIWHAEGDVYTHTRMVADQMLQLEIYKNAAQTDQNTLLLAALLHDIAKPLCTKTEDGRIVSPKHAYLGEKIARELLWDMDFVQREQICALVRLHGLPIWAMEKENPNRAVIAASLRIKNEWLYSLPTADILGRTCMDAPDLLERVHFFKELCLENECFIDRKIFHNAHSHFKFFNDNLAYPPTLFDDTAFEITLLSGIAGCGKDTFAQKMRHPIISLDDLRQKMKVKHGDSKGQGQVIQAAFELGKQYCIRKQSFVWNSTNLTEDTRSKIIQKFGVYHPRFKIVYIETSMETIFSRRSEYIPMASLEKMQQILEMPLPQEAHSVEYFRN
jgi:putative nucleotidyltransferase with HDIG domain